MFPSLDPDATGFQGNSWPCWTQFVDGMETCISHRLKQGWAVKEPLLSKHQHGVSVPMEMMDCGMLDNDCVCIQTHLGLIFSQGGRCLCGRVCVWSSSSVPLYSPPHSRGVYSETWGVNAFLHSSRFPYAWEPIQRTNTQLVLSMLKWGSIPVFWSDCNCLLLHITPKYNLIEQEKEEREHCMTLNNVHVQLRWCNIPESCHLYSYASKLYLMDKSYSKGSNHAVHGVSVLQ